MIKPAVEVPAAPAAPPGPDVAPAAAVTLTLADVTRSFAGRRVLGPLTLRLDTAAVGVVHGPNGTGKTTLLRVAAGMLVPTNGVRACTGRAVYLRPGSGARHALTVRRALAHTAALAGTPAPVVDEACQLAGLTTALTARRVGELSAGQHARLSVALAVVATPALACLDEPTAHLDADGVDRVRALVRMLTDRGAAVLLASHSPAVFRDLADTGLALDEGLLRETRW